MTDLPWGSASVLWHPAIAQRFDAELRPGTMLIDRRDGSSFPYSGEALTSTPPQYVRTLGAAGVLIVPGQKRPERAVPARFAAFVVVPA